MYSRFLEFIAILRMDYSNYYEDIVISLEKMRIILKDKSWIEILYPLEKKFSFHFQKGSLLYRIDTAPHHKYLKSYPTHIHFKTELNVIENDVLSLDNTPENNFRAFINWIKNLE